MSDADFDYLLQRMRNDPNLIGRFTALPGNPPPVLLYLQVSMGGTVIC